MATDSTLAARAILLGACDILDITDEEAGEPQWQAYLNEGQLYDAMVRLRGERPARDAMSLALADTRPACQHDWHRQGAVNGRRFSVCQSCGAEKFDDE